MINKKIVIIIMSMASIGLINFLNSNSLNNHTALSLEQLGLKSFAQCTECDEATEDECKTVVTPDSTYVFSGNEIPC